MRGLVWQPTMNEWRDAARREWQINVNVLARAALRTGIGSTSSPRTAMCLLETTGGCCGNDVTKGQDGSVM